MVVLDHRSKSPSHKLTHSVKFYKGMCMLMQYADQRPLSSMTLSAQTASSLRTA